MSWIMIFKSLWFINLALGFGLMWFIALGIMYVLNKLGVDTGIEWD